MYKEMLRLLKPISRRPLPFVCGVVVESDSVEFKDVFDVVVVVVEEGLFVDVEVEWVEADVVAVPFVVDAVVAVVVIVVLQIQLQGAGASDVVVSVINVVEIVDVAVDVVDIVELVDVLVDLSEEHADAFEVFDAIGVSIGLNVAVVTVVCGINVVVVVFDGFTFLDKIWVAKKQMKNTILKFTLISII